MVRLGNTEIDLSDLIILGDLAGAPTTVQDADDEVHVSFVRPSYTAQQVMALIAVVNNLRPDECDIVGRHIVLWWHESHVTP